MEIKIKKIELNVIPIAESLYEALKMQSELMETFEMPFSIWETESKCFGELEIIFTGVIWSESKTDKRGYSVLKGRGIKTWDLACFIDCEEIEFNHLDIYKEIENRFNY